MHVCLCCICFSFSVLSQEIGWEERLQNDLIFGVEWDVKPQINQSSAVNCLRLAVNRPVIVGCRWIQGVSEGRHCRLADNSEGEECT